MFCCGLHASAEKISHAHKFKQFFKSLHSGHEAPVFTIDIINNHTVVPSGTDAPDGYSHFKGLAFPGKFITGNNIFIGRLLPDLHSIVKLIIFPQHYFW